MRILFWDIETAPMIAAVWGLYNQNIQHESILQDWYMICAAWEFLDGGGIHTTSLLDDPKRFADDVADDEHVVRAMHNVLSNADVLVAHNGDNFDLKKFNARALDHGLPPLPPIATVDTLKVARQNFKISSNRLDYLGTFLGVGNKISTPKGLWIRSLRGDPKAIEEMVVYNKGDIDLLKAVYFKLLPYMRTHPNRNLFTNEGSDHVCPKCGSGNLTKQGTRIATRLGTRQQWQCGDCGGWSTTGKMVTRASMR